MRPVDKSLFDNNQETYHPYGRAKDDLISALGSYCSYCERQGFYAALAVEHIQDKNTFPACEFNWNNFLLSCTNCNSIKGNKAVDGILLPDRDNTFSIFIYLESGFIQTSPSLNETLRIQSQALIDLVGLDRVPGRNGYIGKDKLWLNRKESWELAQRYLNKYEQNKCDVETIKDLAVNKGFWSVWMQVFKNFPEIQKNLINAFSGTRKIYFQNILNQ